MTAGERRKMSGQNTAGFCVFQKMTSGFHLPSAAPDLQAGAVGRSQVRGNRQALDQATGFVEGYGYVAAFDIGECRHPALDLCSESRVTEVALQNEARR